MYRHALTVAPEAVGTALALWALIIAGLVFGVLPWVRLIVVGSEAVLGVLVRGS